jgi:glycerate kinase
VIVAGDIGEDIDEVYDLGVSAVFSTNLCAVDFEFVKERAEENLYRTMDNIMRLISTLGCMAIGN